MVQNLCDKLTLSLLFNLKDKKNATHKLSSITISSKTIKLVYVDHFPKERDALLKIVQTYLNYVSWYRALVDCRYQTVIVFSRCRMFDNVLKLFNSDSCEIIPSSIKKRICEFTDYDAEVVNKLLFYVQPIKINNMNSEISEMNMIEMLELDYINNKEIEGQYSSELTDYSCFEY